MKRMGNKKLVPLTCSVDQDNIIRLTSIDDSQLVNVSNVSFRVIGHLENYQDTYGKVDLLFILHPNSTEYQVHGNMFNVNADGLAEYGVYLNMDADNNYLSIGIAKGVIGDIVSAHKFVGYAIFDEVDPLDARIISVDY